MLNVNVSLSVSDSVSTFLWILCGELYNNVSLYSCYPGFLAFVKQMEWVRSQWAAAEAENIRLQGELDEALKTMAKWENKFAHVRKLLDGEKRERNIILKKYNDLVRYTYSRS